MLTLDEVDRVAWTQEKQPPWNEEGEVANALRDLALASPETGERAYSRLLYAFGNNHAGTYYPVVVTAVPFLGAILRSGTPTGRLRTLDVLIDLVGSFEPAAGFEVVATPTGNGALRTLLHQEVLALEPDVVRCQDEARSTEESALAQRLLADLREQ
jgi:hypothetical protein